MMILTVYCNIAAGIIINIIIIIIPWTIMNAWCTFCLMTRSRATILCISNTLLRQLLMSNRVANTIQSILSMILFHTLPDYFRISLPWTKLYNLLLPMRWLFLCLLLLLILLPLFILHVILLFFILFLLRR